MDTSDHLANALKEARLENAQLINRVRAAASGVFALALTLLGTFLGDDWSQSLPFVWGYFVLAVGLAVGGHFSSRVLMASRFAVPVFDMPMVFLIQLKNLGAADDAATARAVAEYSIALFVCLIMLSAFTLSSRHVLISLFLAILFEHILQVRAEVDMTGQALSTIVLCVATMICAFAGRNRIGMVESMTEANVRRLRLQRYFSPGVGEMLEGHDEDDLSLGQERELTVLFLDIRGFTALSEKLNSREVVSLLNDYHAHMVEVLFRHGGTLDKYLGDGLVAYFNAPIQQVDHAERAILCATEMMEELESLNKTRAADGGNPLKMGIGIHSGLAVVGDIGAPNRREFTAIGSAVNIASRLEGMSKTLSEPVVVSATTVALIEGRTWRALGAHQIRGREEALELFTPGGEEIS